MAKLIKKSGFPFTHIVPLSETFFVCVEVPDVKLNRELVLLNYGRLSPFSGGDVLFFRDGKTLYLWFVKSPLEEKRISIPEGYLIYKRFRDKKNVVVIKDSDDGKHISIIKDGKLVSEIFKRKADGVYINMLTKRHGLGDAETVHLVSDTSYRVGIGDALAFLPALDINLGSFLKKVYDDLKLPAIVFLLMVDVLGVVSYEYVNKLFHRKEAELVKLKQSNVKVKEIFASLEKTAGFFKFFIRSELARPDLYNILSTVADIVKKHNGRILVYRESDTIIGLRVVSDGTSSIVDDLVASGMFENVQVLRISQWYEDKTKEVGQIEMRVKLKGFKE
ncbi:hypothetical protein [Persephonella sp.]